MYINVAHAGLPTLATVLHVHVVPMFKMYKLLLRIHSVKVASFFFKDLSDALPNNPGIDRSVYEECTLTCTNIVQYPPTRVIGYMYHGSC